MKGVIAGICPSAETIDVTHEVQPFEIAQGGFLLSQGWRYFPKGTIHVAVVDPGVGSSRRPILAEAGGHLFIGPDNGLFSMIFEKKVRHITAERYFRHPVSTTFHGRDVFAPVAAHVAAGVAPAKMGKLVADYTKLDFWQPVRSGKRTWAGIILHIDRFGNVVTNFRSTEFTRSFEIRAGLQTVGTLAERYSEMPFGELFIISGSAGFLEISVNQGSAAKLLGVGLGAPLELRLGSAIEA
jgi:S-adenosylmethionine hydrolase